ncbi:MAG: TlpA disulfide reductase family protein [Pseudomonadota bacterium]
MVHRILLIVGLLLLTPIAMAQETPVQLRELSGAIVDWQRPHEKDGWLLLKVWSPDCRVCHETAHEVVALDKQGAANLRILGIALHHDDNVSAVRDFIRQHQIEFQNLLDDGSSVRDIYKSATGNFWGGWTPTFLLFAPGGKLAAKNIGPVRAQDVVAFIHNYSPP